MSSRAAILVPVALMVACGQAGGGSTTPASQSYTISGTLSLLDSDTAYANCIGTGGYSDISPRTQVVVKSESGTVLGTTNLGNGKVAGDTSLPVECDYSYKVS